MIVGDGVSLIYKDDSHCFEFSWFRIQKCVLSLRKFVKILLFSVRIIYTV